MIKKCSQLIGQGGQCKIYKKYVLEYNAYQAIKRCHKSDPESYQKLKNEINILKQLNCEFIIKVRKISENTNHLNVYMDYAKYGSLENVHQLFKPKKHSPSLITSRIVTTWLMHMLIAIDNVHKLGYVHGDIKPQNILVFERNDKYINPRLVLIDFGIARKIDELGIQWESTETFMSPQQIANEQFSEKTDIYSLGIVFYYIITQQLPFSDDGKEIKLLKMRKHQFKRIKALIPEFDNNLAHIVEEMLQYDEESRPSAKQLLQKKIFQSRLERFGYLQHIYDTPINQNNMNHKE